MIRYIFITVVGIIIASNLLQSFQANFLSGFESRVESRTTVDQIDN